MDFVSRGNGQSDFSVSIPDIVLSLLEKRYGKSSFGSILQIPDHGADGCYQLGNILFADLKYLFGVNIEISMSDDITHTDNIAPRDLRVRES